ncbi:Gamma-interferon-responsive lysosomal thiol protein [Bienertia sinuspersici]
MASILQRCFSLLVYLTIIQVCLGSSNVADIVKLDLYYESLCPSCSNFITNKLPIIFINGIIDIVDLHLFPRGNAKLASNNSFTCQHGPDECLLNTVEACAINTLPAEYQILFIECVETLVYKGKYTQWETCFKKLSLDPKAVTDCYKGEEGKRFELKYAALTSALKPPHEYVPWVVVAGKPLYENYEDFISYVCKAYKGPLPSACKEHSLASAQREKTNHVHRACYAEQTTELSFLMKIWSFLTSWMV